MLLWMSVPLADLDERVVEHTSYQFVGRLVFTRDKRHLESSKVVTWIEVTLFRIMFLSLHDLRK